MSEFKLFGQVSTLINVFLSDTKEYFSILTLIQTISSISLGFVKHGG